MRTWTVEEAREYLPRLRQLLELISEALVPGPEPRTLTFRQGAEHAEAAFAELQAEGVVLRQVQHGLVDFVWEGPDGEVRLLCWRVDEPDLMWWHSRDGGFAGRRAIADITWPGEEG